MWLYSCQEGEREMIFPDDNDRCVSWEHYSSCKIPLHQGHAKREGSSVCYIKLTVQRQDRHTNVRKQLNSVGQCADVQLFTHFRQCSKGKFGRCFADVYSEFLPSTGRCTQKFEDDYFKVMGTGGPRFFLQHQLGFIQRT